MHTRTDALNLTNIWDNVSTPNSQSYWQNAANQLQNADGPWGQKVFYYDGVGNRIEERSTPSGGTLTVDTSATPQPQTVSFSSRVMPEACMRTTRRHRALARL